MSLLQLEEAPAGKGPPLPPQSKTMYYSNDDNDKANKPIRKRKKRKSFKRRMIEQIQLTITVEKELVKKAACDDEKRDHYLAEIEILRANRRIWRANLYNGLYNGA